MMHLKTAVAKRKLLTQQAATAPSNTTTSQHCLRCTCANACLDGITRSHARTRVKLVLQLHTSIRCARCDLLILLRTVWSAVQQIQMSTDNFSGSDPLAVRLRHCTRVIHSHVPTRIFLAALQLQRCDSRNFSGTAPHFSQLLHASLCVPSQPTPSITFSSRSYTNASAV